MTDFEGHIKQWVNMDNKVKLLLEEIRTVRLEKNKTEEKILTFVAANQLQKATVNISDGNLRFVTVKQTPTLTLTYIEKCLVQCMNNPEQVKKIMQVIKDERNAKYVPDIKRTYKSI
jgi:hypothetical protein